MKSLNQKRLFFAGSQDHIGIRGNEKADKKQRKR